MEPGLFDSSRRTASHPGGTPGANNFFQTSSKSNGFPATSFTLKGIEKNTSLVRTTASSISRNAAGGRAGGDSWQRRRTGARVSPLPSASRSVYARAHGGCARLLSLQPDRWSAPERSHRPPVAGPALRPAHHAGERGLRRDPQPGPAGPGALLTLSKAARTEL